MLRLLKKIFWIPYSEIERFHDNLLKMRLFSLFVFSLALLFDNASCQCSDSIVATFIEEVLSMKDTIYEMQLEMQSDDSCSCSSDGSSEEGTFKIYILTHSILPYITLIFY